MTLATLCLAGSVNGFAGINPLPSPPTVFSRKSVVAFMSSEEFYGKQAEISASTNSNGDFTPVRGRKRRALRRAVQKVFDTALLIDDDDESPKGDGQHMTDKEKADAVFDRLDTDGDGTLSRTELSSYGLQLGSLNALDANRDGTIDRLEFERAVEMLQGRINTSGQKVSDTDELVEELEETLGDLEPLERQELRLGGFEPYILVSVLTAQASFEEISDVEISWDKVFKTSSLLDFSGESWYSIGILLSAAGATITGIYATVVFSLTILYGKTALGMDRDDDYYSFMDGTGLQRFRAFQAFTYSLFLFSISVLLEVTMRCPEIARLPVASASAAFLYFGKTEYDTIMKAAAPMFAPKQAPAPKEEESLEEESTNGLRVEANVSDAVNDAEERIDECYLARGLRSSNWAMQDKGGNDCRETVEKVIREGFPTLHVRNKKSYLTLQ